MSSIDHFDLRSFDLNLLVVFDALMEERSVTRAATRLRVQQPAMSHSLSTLRVLLQDELFVRAGQVMRPTARAQVLAPRIREALRRVQDTLRQEEHFDPATQDRVFRLGFSSELELLVLPDLTAELRRSAPGIRLLGRWAARDEVHHLLDEGTLDLAIGCFDAGSSRHRHLPLFEQSLSCCFNPSLLDLKPPIDVDTYIHTSHALLTLKDSLQGCLSEALERIDTQLNVVMAASDFLSVLAAATEGPVLATLPSHMARRYAPRFDLCVSPVPLDLRLPAVSMVWSSRVDRDPAALWLRERITSLLAGCKV
jgi:DNA-binding transcriptional LysR family regulator